LIYRQEREKVCARVTMMSFCSTRSVAFLVLCSTIHVGYAFVGVSSKCNNNHLFAANQEIIPGESCTGEKIAVVGATGYIGRAVVRESVRRGYPTTAVMRDTSKVKNFQKYFDGSELRQFDVTEGFLSNPDKDGGLFQLADNKLFQDGNVDVVVCCLASRTGTKKDSFAIDYQASLDVAKAAKAAGARRFVLLSAYCVLSAERQDPYALQFQYAKLKLENEIKLLCDENKIDFVSVRPTAFFKSVSGQLEVVNSGAPFVYFDLDGNGKCARCNPISEPDLASALIDQIADDSHKNSIWNLGGPDEQGYSMREQGAMIHGILKKDGEPKLLGVPIGIFDVIINGLQWAADTFQSEKLDDAAELGRIGKYYAVEDMLTTNESEKYGKTTLRQHYEYIAENGQEYDPYTTVFGNAKAKAEFQKQKQEQ